MSLIIGIDLGTTYSAAALVRDGAPQIVQHGDERIMPSVVGLGPDGTLLVGTPARNQHALYPEQTIRSIKRKMGQATSVSLGERSYTPPAISALILRELKRRVEAQVGAPVERAVITVPAYFSDAARQATREAGEIAGFTVERIINEPTAAALAYGLDRSDERQFIAVYDLGGGTFDVSIIELDSGVVEVRASHGNTQLGGDDFDERLSEYLAERFTEQHGVDPRGDRRAMARLLRAAEQAKIALSSQTTAQILEEYLLTTDAGPLHLELSIERDAFEGLIADLLEGTIESFDAALRDAKITAEQLDHVLLVGGSTRIPLVWELVESRTGREPTIAVNPDEAVALGAAVQAAIIAGEPLDAILVDVTPHSLGIEVAEFDLHGQMIPDRYNVIIHRNTAIPTSRAEIYHAIHPGQAAINLKIYQGEQPVASRNTLLGEFLFDQLRPEVPGAPPRITVQFDFDVNGILKVSAFDHGSRKQAHTSVRASHVLRSSAEIAGSRAELEDLEQVLVASAPAPAASTTQMSLATISLLSRAQHALSTNPDHPELSRLIRAVEHASAVGDEDALAEQSEALIDLLYDLDDA